MKYTNKLLTIAALLSLFLAFSCKDKKKETPTPEVPGAVLAGTWEAVREDAISAPAEAIAEDFADFTITFNPTTNSLNYSTTNSGDPLIFPASGTLEGVEASDNFQTATNVTRQPDNVSMDITLLENGQALRLEFTIDTQDAGHNKGNARVAGIEGKYVFTLDKQQE